MFLFISIKKKNSFQLKKKENSLQLKKIHFN